MWKRPSYCPVRIDCSCCTGYAAVNDLVMGSSGSQGPPSTRYRAEKVISTLTEKVPPLNNGEVSHYSPLRRPFHRGDGRLGIIG